MRLRLHQAVASSRPGDGLESWLQATTVGPDARNEHRARAVFVRMSAVSAGAIVPANDARQSSARSRAKVVHLSVTSNKDDKQEHHHTNDHAPASSRSCGLFTKWSRSAGHGALPAVSSEGYLRRLRMGMVGTVAPPQHRLRQPSR